MISPKMWQSCYLGLAFCGTCAGLFAVPQRLVSYSLLSEILLRHGLAKAVMGLSQFLYVELLSFLLDWCQCENDEDTLVKTEQLESMRECLRSILGVCGIYRMTEVVAEAWVVLTGVKLHGDDRPIDSPPVPIAGAAPSPVASDLCHIQWLPHASILEEELISALDLLEELQCSSELLGSQQVGIWLRDLRFVVATAHFIMVHRMNRDA